MQELYWIYAFNIIVNSFLSFFTAIVLIEAFVLLLRIKDARVKVICRFLPFCKVCLDLFSYHFSNWALVHGVNPLLAETGTRRLSVMVNPFTGIQLSMQDGKTFTLADLIAFSVNPLWIRAIVLIGVGGTIIACILLGIRILQDKRRIDLIVKNAIFISRPNLYPNNLKNRHLGIKPSLMQYIKKANVHFAISPAVDAPCITGKTILFPIGCIEHLSKEQLDGIVAHEIAHLQCRDCSLRLTYALIAAIFWWIPTKWWQRQIEEMQEQASDSMIHRFGISRFALAEAVLKTAQQAKTIPSKCIFSFVESPFSLKRRMQKLLEDPIKQPFTYKTIQYSLLASGLLSVLFGRLWIF